MYRAIATCMGAIPLLICGCAATEAVSVVQSEPTGCKFLAVVSVHQCGMGGPAAETIDALSAETRKIGGDTMQCCETDTDVTVLYGVNPKTGKQTCTDFLGQYARAFVCKSKEIQE